MDSKIISSRGRAGAVAAMKSASELDEFIQGKMKVIDDALRDEMSCHLASLEEILSKLDSVGIVGSERHIFKTCGRWNSAFIFDGFTVLESPGGLGSVNLAGLNTVMFSMENAEIGVIFHPDCDKETRGAISHLFVEVPIPDDQAVEVRPPKRRPRAVLALPVDVKDEGLFFLGEMLPDVAALARIVCVSYLTMCGLVEFEDGIEALRYQSADEVMKEMVKAGWIQPGIIGPFDLRWADLLAMMVVLNLERQDLDMRDETKLATSVRLEELPVGRSHVLNYTTGLWSVIADGTPLTSIQESFGCGDNLGINWNMVHMFMESPLDHKTKTGAR